MALSCKSWEIDRKLSELFVHSAENVSARTLTMTWFALWECSMLLLFDVI